MGIEESRHDVRLSFLRREPFRKCKHITSSQQPVNTKFALAQTEAVGEAPEVKGGCHKLPASIHLTFVKTIPGTAFMLLKYY